MVDIDLLDEDAATAFNHFGDSIDWLTDEGAALPFWEKLSLSSRLSWMSSVALALAEAKVVAKEPPSTAMDVSPVSLTASVGGELSDVSG